MNAPPSEAPACFTLAKDPAYISALCTRHFGLHDAPRLDRLRERPGERVIAQYALADTWVTALAYPADERERIWRKLHRPHTARPTARPNVIAEANARETPQSDCTREFAGQLLLTEQLALQCAESGLILQRFPLDWKLDGLQTLVTHPELLGDALVAQAGSDSARASITVARYRAGLNATLRCELAGATAYAKVYAGGVSAAQHTLATLMRQPFFQTPRPLAVLSAFNTLVLPAARGTPFDVCIARDPRAAVCIAERIGRALAGFHFKSGLVFDRTHSAANEHVNIRRAAAYLCRADTTNASAITAQAEAVCAALRDPAIPRPIHRDLKADHFFVDDTGGAITLIDTDSCAMGDPALDLALLVTRLRMLAPGGADIAGALEAAYAAAAPPEWRPGYPAALAAAALDVAGSAARRPPPG